MIKEGTSLRRGDSDIVALSLIVAFRLLSPFAPRKCALLPHFCGAKGDNCVWHAQSEAWA